jgi:hypothetical protein
MVSFCVLCVRSFCVLCVRLSDPGSEDQAARRCVGGW